MLPIPVSLKFSPTGAATCRLALLLALGMLPAGQALAVADGYLDGVYDCTVGTPPVSARLAVNSHRDGRLIYLLTPLGKHVGPNPAWAGHGAGQAREQGGMEYRGNTASGEPFRLAIGQIEVDGGAGLEQVTLTGVLGKTPLACRSAW